MARTVIVGYVFGRTLAIVPAVAGGALLTAAYGTVGWRLERRTSEAGVATGHRRSMVWLGAAATPGRR